MKRYDWLVAAQLVVRTVLHSEDKTRADRLAFQPHLGSRTRLCSAHPDMMEKDSEGGGGTSSALFSLNVTRSSVI